MCAGSPVRWPLAVALRSPARDVGTGLIERLEWDSAFFGFPVGRVCDGIGPEQIRAAVQEADRREIRCTYLLVAAKDHRLLDCAQEQGFRVRDIRVQLERPVAGHPVTATGLRRGEAGDLPRLREIMRERFQGTRFFADTRFPVDRSAELYVTWLCRGLSSEDGWAALVTDDLSGFVVCHLDAPARTGRITLIGVATDATGRGLGRALVAGAGALFEESDLLTAVVVTQGHNVAAQSLYQASGYRTCKTHLWLHRWL